MEPKLIMKKIYFIFNISHSQKYVLLLTVYFMFFEFMPLFVLHVFELLYHSVIAGHLRLEGLLIVLLFFCINL